MQWSDFILSNPWNSYVQSQKFSIKNYDYILAYARVVWVGRHKVTAQNVGQNEHYENILHCDILTKSRTLLKNTLDTEAWQKYMCQIKANAGWKLSKKGFFYWHHLNLNHIPAWISNYNHYKV